LPLLPLVLESQTKAIPGGKDELIHDAADHIEKASPADKTAVNDKLPLREGSTRELSHSGASMCIGALLVMRM
jgi:hypothetical protein